MPEQSKDKRFACLRYSSRCINRLQVVPCIAFCIMYKNKKTQLNMIRVEGRGQGVKEMSAILADQ